MQKSSFRARSLNEPALQTKARQKLTELLALPKRKTPLQAKTRSVNRRPGAVIDEIQFDSEPGMRIPGWFAAPSSGSGPRPVVLYLTEYAGDEVVEEPGSMDRVLAAGCSVCAIGLRGAINLTMPRFPDNGPLYYSDGSVFVWERFAWTCLVLGRSVLGQRVWDALRAVDYLATRSDVDKSQIRILGIEGAGTVALMTAFLDPRVRAVLLNRTLVSYMSIVESETYSLRLDWFAPGILRDFDLPEIASGVGPRPCWLLNGVDANGRGMPLSAMQEQYGPKLFGEATLPKTLRFVVNSGEDPQSTYLDWLKST